MPSRIIRDGILTSERINALSERAELFYRRLMSVVDDHGRFHASMSLLCSYCYPLKRTMREETVKGLLAECVKVGVVVLYEVAGKPYLEVQDFGQRVQSKSKYPAPTGSTVIHGDSPGNTALVVVGDGVVIEDGSDGAEPPAPPPAVTLPLNTGEEFPITVDQALEFGSLYPAVDVQAELRKMRGWLIANPANRKTKAGVLRFVTRWLGQEQDKAGKSGVGKPQTSAAPAGKPKGPSESPLESAVAYARQQFAFGAIDEDERDRRIAEATAKHRGIA